MRELDNLAARIQVLLSEAKRIPEQHDLISQNIPAWLWGWESPWKGKIKGGQLISLGEDELYRLGIRVRERFPDIFSEEYHPDVFTVRTTQVSI